MVVSVVIPTFNGEPWLDETLNAVRRQKVDAEVEIICIDSGSRDRTLEICRAHGARLIEIEPGAFSHGATRNAAIESTGGEIICLLTQDALPADEYWLPSLVAAVDENPRVAGAYSRQAPRPDASPITRHLLENWLTHRRQRVEQRIDDLDSYLSLAPFEKMKFVCFDNVSSALRRSVWLEHPFASLPFGEDLDWSKRVMEAGYSIIFEPASVVIHSHERSHLYEFKRTIVSHHILRELFGMQLIAHWWHVAPCTRRVWREYRAVLEASPEAKSWRTQFDALLRGFLSNLAQYLGGNARDWGDRLPMLRPLGALVRRNV